MDRKRSWPAGEGACQHVGVGRGAEQSRAGQGRAGHSRAGQQCSLTCVPDLQPYHRVRVAIDDALGQEAGADRGGDLGRIERALAVARHQRRLAHALRPDHHDLGLEGRHGRGDGGQEAGSVGRQRRRQRPQLMLDRAGRSRREMRARRGREDACKTTPEKARRRQYRRCLSQERGAGGLFKLSVAGNGTVFSRAAATLRSRNLGGEERPALHMHMRMRICSSVSTSPHPLSVPRLSRSGKR